MKTSELVLSRTLWTVSFLVGALTIGAIAYAFFQIAIGNYHGTASFEF